MMKSKYIASKKLKKIGKIYRACAYCNKEVAFKGAEYCGPGGCYTRANEKCIRCHAAVLDHGYIRHVEHWGIGDAEIAEAGIIEAARQSTQKSFKGWGTKEEPGDEKLLKYLYEHQHNTPFEFAGLIIEVQAPIFVFREWHRHRTQSYNEMSARYEPLPDLNYIPTVERLMMNSKTNKQAGALKDLSQEDATYFVNQLKNIYAINESSYQSALLFGVPKELARLIIPVGRYSRMRASANLRNWLAFMTLRSEKNLNAQWEIRQYANALGKILTELFPKTMELFNA